MIAHDLAVWADDAHIAVGNELVDLISLPRNLAVIRGQHVAINGSVALSRSGVAPRDIGGAILMPFNSVVRVDIDGLLAAARRRKLSVR